MATPENEQVSVEHYINLREASRQHKLVLIRTAMARREQTYLKDDLTASRDLEVFHFGVCALQLATHFDDEEQAAIGLANMAELLFTERRQSLLTCLDGLESDMQKPPCYDDFIEVFAAAINTETEPSGSIAARYRAMLDREGQQFLDLFPPAVGPPLHKKALEQASSQNWRYILAGVGVAAVAGGLLYKQKQVNAQT